MTTFKEHLAEMLQNPEFKAEYDALAPEFNLIKAMIIARRDANLTQEMISERSGITQGDISKIEKGKGNPSLKTLQRLAAAMNTRLVLDFVPLES